MVKKNRVEKLPKKLRDLIRKKNLGTKNLGKKITGSKKIRYKKIGPRYICVKGSLINFFCKKLRTHGSKRFRSQNKLGKKKR